MVAKVDDKSPESERKEAPRSRNESVDGEEVKQEQKKEASKEENKED